MKSTDPTTKAEKRGNIKSFVDGLIADELIDEGDRIPVSILTASAFVGVGTSVESVADILDLSRDKVEPVAARLRDSGLWETSPMPMPATDIEFLQYVLIAQGLIERVQLPTTVYHPDDPTLKWERGSRGRPPKWVSELADRRVV